MRKIAIAIIILVFLVSLGLFGLPAFAQTYVAAIIPGQPLSKMAAEQIITDSGLPIEKLPDGTTGSLTRGRDAVNAYRYAHTMLYKNGWYRGVSEDHTPLLVAMVNTLEKEGYTSAYANFEPKKTEILQKFWYASDTQNVQECGFSSLETFYNELDKKRKEGKTKEAEDLRKAFDSKWK